MNPNHRRVSVTALLAACAAGFVLGLLSRPVPVSGAQSRVFEIRTYSIAPGKTEALHARFRDHTLAIFKRHGMESVGYFRPQDAPMSENTLIYVLAHPSREAAKSNWAAFMADPEWQAVKKASEANGPLTTRIDSVFADAADYSPLK